MQLTDRVLQTKTFRSDTNTLATEAADLVRTVKKHIEITNCDHCKRVLNNIEIVAPNQATTRPQNGRTDSNRHNPTDKLGSEYYNG